jgi:prophage antirepressor-like protein
LVTLVTEDGATDLILESRKSQARAFRRWLTHVVWPSDPGQGDLFGCSGTGEELLAAAVLEGQKVIQLRRSIAITSSRRCLYGTRGSPVTTVETLLN